MKTMSLFVMSYIILYYISKIFSKLYLILKIFTNYLFLQNILNLNFDFNGKYR